MMTVASIRMKWFLGPIAIWVLALLTIFAFPRDFPEITGIAILLFPLTGFICSWSSLSLSLEAGRSFEEREAICGDDCMILSDEPLRVTFHFCHAFLYWPDIVHDPSGAVSDQDISRLHRLNVYLFGAKRLTGDWYLADFGD